MKGRFVIALLVLSLMGSSLFVFAVITKQRTFDGQISFKLARKNTRGQWDIIDSLTVPKIHFEGSLAALGTNKEIRSAFVFSRQTEKGNPITVSLPQAALGNADLGSGKWEFDFTFHVDVEGQKVLIPLKLTTESVLGPEVTVSGRRSIFDPAKHTASLALVGASSVTASEAIQKTFLPNDNPVAGQQFLLLVSGDGIVTALN